MRKLPINCILIVAIAIASLTAAVASGAGAPARSAATGDTLRRASPPSTAARKTDPDRRASSKTHRRHRRRKPAHTRSPHHRKHRHKAKRHRRRHASTVIDAPSAAAPAGGGVSPAAPPPAIPAAAGTSSPSPGGGSIAARRPPLSPACSQTVSSVSGVAGAVSGAGGEAVVCLVAGAYGHLGLSGSHAGNVTVEPVPGSSVSLEGVSFAAGSSGITVHDFSISGGVSLAAGDSHIAIDHNDIDGQGSGGDGEGVETLSVNCSAPGAPSYAGCTTTTPDTYLTINGNKIHGYGEGDTEDAIHLNDWEHVTVTANDIYDLEEHGNHTDALQSVFGGHYMTFAYNYEHDNQAQGFFIKDGDASEVTVTENLFLTNNNLGEDEYNLQVFNTTGLSMTNNTVWDGQADIIRAEGSAQALTATVNHNVEQNFDVLDENGPAYTLSENDDIFKEAPFTFNKGAQSKVEANPDFADPATNDYELANNPNNTGIDWQPSEYIYGPTGN
jgi:hypothetical protein